MAGPRRIFVSYSSQDRALVTALVDALKTAAGGDPEIWIDARELESGQSWPRQLHEQLARCTAGLIVLTDSSIQSDWVLKETTILTWRNALDRGFSVFIPQARDVVDAALKAAHFGPTFLQYVQQLDVAADDPAGVAAGIMQRIGTAHPPSLFDRVLSTLADVLEQGPSRALRELGDSLGVLPPTIPNDPNYLDAVARALFTGEQPLSLDRLVNDFGYSWRQEPLKKLVNLIAPFWVEAEAAGRLHLLADAPPAWVWIDGAFVPDYTAEMYVRRTFPISLGRQTRVHVPGGSGGPIVNHVVHSVCEALRIRREQASRATDEQIVADLKKRRSSFFVILPFIPDDAAMRTLEDTFPKALFIVSDDGATDASTLKPIQPTIDRAREQLEYDRWQLAKESLDNANA